MMRILTLIALLLLSNLSFGQTLSPPYQPSKNQLLSTDAYSVYKTNKYLDFKDNDTLVELINDTTLKKIDLYNFFGYKMDWAKIENESFITYKQEGENNIYTFLDSTMIETKDEYGSYDVRRVIKTIYNSKGFILNREEKVYVGDNLNETRSIINEFDEKNRVTKITKGTDRKNKKENQQQIIDVIYDQNFLTVKSDYGTIICKFIKNENSIGYVSKLSSRQTASYFMYAMAANKFDLAKEYCTDKMIKVVNEFANLKTQFEEVKFIEGNEYISEKVSINDIWEMKYSTNNKEKYKVDFVIIKQKNGWKIDEFKIQKS